MDALGGANRGRVGRVVEAVQIIGPHAGRVDDDFRPDLDHISVGVVFRRFCQPAARARFCNGRDPYTGQVGRRVVNEAHYRGVVHGDSPCARARRFATRKESTGRRRPRRRSRRTRQRDGRRDRVGKWEASSWAVMRRWRLPMRQPPARSYIQNAVEYPRAVARSTAPPSPKRGTRSVSG